MYPQDITLTIGRQKRIALIAHDNKKADILDWCEENQEILKGHFLCGTGTTARMITDRTGLPVRGYNSGPLGGDQQIGAKIVEGKIDFIVFFADPLTAQPHDTDVKALMRIAEVYDIPIAINKASADFMIHSLLMDQEYDHKVINFQENIRHRAKTVLNDSEASHGESDHAASSDKGMRVDFKKNHGQAREMHFAKKTRIA